MPPNLDLGPEPSRNPDLISIYDKILNHLYGVALRLDANGRIVQIGSGWDELANRTDRDDLARNSVLGRPLWDLSKDEESRSNLRMSLGSLARGQTEQAMHPLDLGNPQKPLLIQLSLSALHDDGQCMGFLAHGVDVTTEHVIRLALLDRERKLRELKATCEQHGEQVTALENEIVRLTEKLTAKDEELDMLCEQQAAYQERIESLSTQHASGEEQFTALQTQKTALERQISERNGEITALEEQVAIFQIRTADLEEKLASLSSERWETDAQRQAETSEWESTIGDLLSAFRKSPDDFHSRFCRIACETGGAVFSTLTVFASDIQRFRYVAQHGAPDFHRYMIDNSVVELALGEGPEGIAAEKGCPTKFDHLLEREDFAKWAPVAEQNGYNCIWAFPLSDEEGIYGVLQLYYAEEDAALPVPDYTRLSRICQFAVPLLRVGDTWPATADSHDEPPASAHVAKPEGFRTLASDLAEEFSNLLTGVLGHSSLVAAEMGESSTAIEDVRAIERSARGAARLTRKLSALCGAGHKAAAPFDLAAYLKTYVRDRANYFPSGAAGVALPSEPCTVHAESAVLEIMLDGMADHARRSGSGSGTPTWTLNVEHESARLSLTYSGPAALPGWWDDGLTPTHHRAQLHEIAFSREAAQAHGGSLQFIESDGTTQIILMLPLAVKKIGQQAG
ncbi:PAS domain-containing protein [bacterium]|nr:PAS domain-containing protein [bacterium]MBU1983335.1 PAS domain-containing protein [bacterium]